LENDVIVPNLLKERTWLHSRNVSWLRVLAEEWGPNWTPGGRNKRFILFGRAGK
jgi:hypothetical protein